MKSDEQLVYEEYSQLPDNKLEFSFQEVDYEQNKWPLLFMATVGMKAISSTINVANEFDVNSNPDMMGSSVIGGLSAVSWKPMTSFELDENEINIEDSEESEHNNEGGKTI